MKNIALTVLLTFLTFSPAFAGEKSKESTYDRVMRTGTIRCGYVVVPPTMIKDQNTGALSGIVYDTMEDMAKSLNLKVEWVEEVGFGTMFEGFKTGRYDAVCFNVIANPERARVADFLSPSYFLRFNVYMKKDSPLASGSLTSLNDPKVKFAAVDGGMSDIFARADFPKAGIFSNSDLTSLPELMMQVATGKADAVIMDAYLGSAFNDAHPETPMTALSYKMFPAAIAIPKDEYPLKSMLDIALQTLQYTGRFDQIIAKYSKYPDAYILAHAPQQGKQ
jgi:ABC-type amino acid transport substrate-binding protein